MHLKGKAGEQLHSDDHVWPKRKRFIRLDSESDSSHWKMWKAGFRQAGRTLTCPYVTAPRKDRGKK